MAMVVIVVAMPMVVVAVAVVVLVFLEEVGVDVQLGVEVEAPQIQHLLERHLAKMHRLDGRTRVHVLEAVRQGIHVLGTHQIRLGQENLVGKTHLAACFLAVVELLRCVLGVHQGDDGVDQVGLGDLFVHEEGLRHRAGVGQAGGFDHDALKVQQALALLGGQQLQGFTQVFTDGAADAAVAHLHDLLFRLRHQDVVVDVFFTKLVLDHGDLLAVGLGQDALEQGGFARAQKAREDGDWNECHGNLFQMN